MPKRTRYDVALKRPGPPGGPRPGDSREEDGLWVQSEQSEYSKRISVLVHVPPRLVDRDPAELLVDVCGAVAREIESRGWDGAPFYMDTSFSVIRGNLDMQPDMEGGMEIRWGSNPAMPRTLPDLGRGVAAPRPEVPTSYTMTTEYLQGLGTYAMDNMAGLADRRQREWQERQRAWEARLRRESMPPSIFDRLSGERM